MDESELTRKIGLLLAKAEGTDNENEAQTFYAKAYQMMAQYSIDEARVRSVARDNNRRVEEPVREDYMFASYAHHAKAKEELLRTVMKSQGVRFYPYDNKKDSNWQRVQAAGKTGLHESQWCMLTGYKGDIENAKMLFLSLLIQSTKFANDDWAKTYGKDRKDTGYPSYEGKFMWISSHMEGFALRIGQRFNELREDLFKGIHDANALWVDKDTNIQEWLYEKGYAKRPTPREDIVSPCYEEQPESLHPKTRAGTAVKNWKPLGCRLYVHKYNANGEYEVEPHPHLYTVEFSYSRGSSYVAKGRRESWAGREAGKSAANRADIGLSRVGNSSRMIKP